MPDIFDEVAEDLRAERTKRFLTRFGVWMIAALVLVVAAVGGYQVWRGYEFRTSAGVADRFLDAMKIADGPAASRASALPGFESVAAEGGAGYRTLARLREAGLKADAGDLAGASALWDQVAGDGTADSVIRDLARLQWALHHVDKGDPADIAAHLAPLTAAGNPWRTLAEEAQATLDLRRGDKDAARDLLKQLTLDATAPDGVRGRANGLLARLGG